MAFSRDRATVIDYNCNNNRSMGPFNRQEAIRMNRKCLSLAIVAFLICVLPLAAAAAQFQADMTMDGRGEKVAGKVFVSGSIMRQEMQVPGGEMGISIIDGVKNVMYVLITQEKMYMEFPNENIVLGDRDVEELLADEADLKKLGTETVEGYKCDKYGVTYKGPRKAEDGELRHLDSPETQFFDKGSNRWRAGQDNRSLHEHQGRASGRVAFRDPEGLPEVRFLKTFWSDFCRGGKLSSQMSSVRLSRLNSLVMEFFHDPRRSRDHLLEALGYGSNGRALERGPEIPERRNSGSI